MIQAFAPDRADEALREGVLPRTVRGGENFTDSHALHPLPLPLPLPGQHITPNLPIEVPRRCMLS